MKKEKKIKAPVVKYSDVEAKEVIIEQLTKGKSLDAILRKDKRLPYRRKIYQWLNAGDEKNYDFVFRNDYAGAREDQADLNADQIESALKDIRKGKLDPAAGRAYIDGLKWIAARKKPKVYGERIDVTTAGNPLEQQILIQIPDNGRNNLKPEE